MMNLLRAEADCEQSLSDIALVAAHLCQAPVALIQLANQNATYFRTPADEDTAAAARELASYAWSVANWNGLWEVPDVTIDARFSDFSRNSESPGVRFFSGLELLTPTGEHAAMLCLFDSVPRRLSEQQREALRGLGRLCAICFGRFLEVSSQRVLSGAEERLRLFVNLDRDCVQTFSADGRLLEINEAGLAMLQAESIDEVRARTLIEFVAPEYRNAFRDLYANVQEGIVGSLIFECFGLRGRRRWLEAQVAPLLEEGQVSGLLSVTRDITDRELASVELREREAFLAEAQRIARLGNWDWNIKSNELRWSDEIYRIFGLAPQEFGANYEAFLNSVHPDDRKIVMQSVDEAFHQLSPYELDHRIVLPDGSIRVVHERAVVIYDEVGRPIRMMGTVQDVTERKKAEQQDNFERQVLELLARDVRLSEVLNFLVRGYEELFPGAVGSVLLLDPEARTLRHAAAPNLPDSYVCKVDGSEAGPCAAFCGAAAHTGRTVIVSNIESDPLRDDYRKLALDHGLRACWSVPIRCRAGAAMGTFTLYFREPRAPLPGEVDALERGSHLAGLAVLRHLTLDELRRSEARFRDLIRAAPDAILIVDRNRCITLANPAADALFGYVPGALTGRMIDDLIPHSVRQVHAAQCASFFQHGTARPMGSGLELQACKADGGEFSVDIMLGPLEIDETALVLCIVRDVTEKRLANARLVQARERLQRAASAGGVGLWDWDLLTNKVYYSPEWKRQIGYAEDEVSEDLSEWNSRLHPDDILRAQAAAKAYLSGEARDFELEFRFRHKDGSYRNILARGSKVDSDDGAPIRMLGSHVDITERVQLQNQFLQAQKMESVGRLAGGIAHDFNNMLSIISGYTELMRACTPVGQPSETYLGEIQEAAARAADLTRQLLAFSRQQILEPQVFDLTRMLLGLEGMLGRLIGEDIELSIRTTPDPAWIKADPGQLHQVAFNLVVNARDAMPQGGRLTIQIQRVTLDTVFARHLDAAAGPYILLSVTDTGAGMDTETLSRIFEPFFTTKEIGKGTGLGLSTVYGIVRQSGGFVDVKSAKGHGSTFDIYLPSTDSPAATVPIPTTARTMGGSETILVVEDEQVLRSLVVDVLIRVGYTVLEASQGAEALQALELHTGDLDLLLTDVVMPRMGGRELAEEVNRRYPRSAVLFMSGYTDDIVMRHGISELEVDFLPKPFVPGALIERVRAVLDRNFAAGKEQPPKGCGRVTEPS